MGDAVDAEEGGGAWSAVAVQQLADHLESRDHVDTVATAEIDRQLGRLVGVFRDADGLDLLAEQPRALERDEAGPVLALLPQQRQALLGIQVPRAQGQRAAASAGFSVCSRSSSVSSSGSSPVLAAISCCGTLSRCRP